MHREGIAESFTDPEKLKHVLESLTEQNESGYPNPWEPDYGASMLRGIIGIEIAITSIQCKFKLSQNRSLQEQLAYGGHEALADEMNKS